MSTAITVITHNGRLPKDGGKRMGYLFTGLDGNVQVVPASLAVLFAKPAPPPAAAKTEPQFVFPQTGRLLIISYRDRDGDVRCPYCNEWNFRVELGSKSCCYSDCGKEFEVVEH